MDSQARKYVAALTSPFSRAANGAQIPDGFSFPTQTRLVKTEYTLRPDVNGNLDFVLLPSLFQSIVGNSLGNVNAGPLVGGATSSSDFQYSQFTPTDDVNVQLSAVGGANPTWVGIFLLDSTQVIRYGQKFQVTGDTNVYVVGDFASGVSGSTDGQSGFYILCKYSDDGVFVPTTVPTTWANTPATLQFTQWTAGYYFMTGSTVPEQVAADISMYRIVGWGARVRCLQAPINQQGRLIFASQPVGPQQVYKPNTEMWYNDILQFYNLPTADSTGCITTQILNLPDSTECMLSDLSLRGGLEWCSKIVSPAAILFRSVSNNAVNSAQNNLGYGLIDNRSVTGTVINKAPAVAGITTGYRQIPSSFVDNPWYILGVPRMKLIMPQTTRAIPANEEFSIIINPTADVFGTFGNAVCGIGDIPKINWCVWQQTLSDFNNGNLDQAVKIAVIYSCYLKTASSGGIITAVATCKADSLVPIDVDTNQTVTFIAPGDHLSSFGNPQLIQPLGMSTNAFNFPQLVASQSPIPTTTYANTVNSATALYVNDVTTAVDNKDIVLNDYIEMKGWSTLMCRGYGLGNSNTPLLSVEVVYHVEGPVEVSGSAGSFLSAGQFPFVDSELMHASMDYAARLPHFRAMAATTQNMLTNMALN
jgi:hypothetical protein